MSKKTNIAFIINSSTQKELKRFVSNNFFLIKKMADNFKKVYIFNLNNFTFFKIPPFKKRDQKYHLLLYVFNFFYINALHIFYKLFFVLFFRNIVVNKYI